MHIVLPALRHSVRLSRELRAPDFEILAPPNRSDVRAYVLPPRYYSRELGPITKTLPVRGGRVQRDLARGISGQFASTLMALRWARTSP